LSLDDAPNIPKKEHNIKSIPTQTIVDKNALPSSVNHQTFSKMGSLLMAAEAKDMIKRPPRKCTKEDTYMMF